MKKTFKRVLSPIIALLMLLSAVTFAPITASAYESNGDYDYSIASDGTVTIVKYYGNRTDLTIPSEIDGHTVTGLASYAFQRDSIITVTIPDTIESIGSLAFYNSTHINKIYVTKGNPFFADIDGVLYNKALTEIVRCPQGTEMTEYSIPKGVTSIGDDAFWSCKNLEKVIIPDGVTNIGSSAFAGCGLIKDFDFPDSVIRVGYQAFAFTEWYNNQPNGLVYVGKVAYSYRRDMPQNTSLTLKEGTVGIAEKAFYECTNLKHIKLPKSIKLIGGRAFWGCTNLERVTLPYGLTTIEERAFFECNRFKSLIIPSSVTDLGTSSVGYRWSDTEGVRVGIADKNYTIYGYKDTAAEKYANNNKINFVAIELLGDADMDGEVTIRDAKHIQRYLSNQLGKDKIDLAACDVNLDGTIDVADVTYLQKNAAQILGDADMDYEITINDVTHIQRYLANRLGEDKINLLVCDANRDGKINVLDATYIQKHLAKLVEI